MPAEGYTRDPKAIANILHNDPGGQAAVDAAAQELVDAANDLDREGESKLSKPYHTDRYVRAVLIPKDKQAKHGHGTRAAGTVAGKRKRYG